MQKSAHAFRTISEVSEWLGESQHVLRFWESKFSQLRPIKRAGGRRYYRPNDMLLLGGLQKLLHQDHMTIKGVQQLLQDKGVAHVVSLSKPLDGTSEDSPAPAGDTSPAATEDSMPQQAETVAAAQAVSSTSEQISDTFVTSPSEPAQATHSSQGPDQTMSLTSLIASIHKVDQLSPASREQITQFLEKVKVLAETRNKA